MSRCCWCNGTEDRLAYPHGSQQLAELVGSDCILKLWEGSYHELHNEPDKDQVLAYILGWIDEHITA
jgi:alpha-beta hydrolase superfamily lysophospholipase